MTINLFFITLTITRRLQSKDKVERNEEINKLMEQSRDKLYKTGDM
ncbi:YrzI family small protein [Metabacillus malikii]|uniref:Uncharacterized protein (TIGR02413 family) n=1 Tax=Metabacillus malikii TaxID=1504265 RepID=A0ABT9ZH10_9BACI|nr:YrzI family small protein [Metabacillus malikii]MDQ0231557.1 uncharacterized protein (TIGR02413 family) [Metabacillus malikii]